VEHTVVLLKLQAAPAAVKWLLLGVGPQWLPPCAAVLAALHPESVDGDGLCQ